jgi:hypothetical protein
MHIIHTLRWRDGRREKDRQTEREREREGTAVKAEGCGRWFRLCAIRSNTLSLELEEAKKEHFSLAAATKTHFAQKKICVFANALFFFDAVPGM